MYRNRLGLQSVNTHKSFFWNAARPGILTVRVSQLFVSSCAVSQVRESGPFVINVQKATIGSWGKCQQTSTFSYPCFLQVASCRRIQQGYQQFWNNFHPWHFFSGQMLVARAQPSCEYCEYRMLAVFLVTVELFEKRWQNITGVYWKTCIRQILSMSHIWHLLEYLF